MGNENKTISFRVNEDAFEDLKEIADERDLQLSQVFRDYVHTMIAHDGRDGSDPAPLVRRAGEVEYRAVDAADGLRKGVLVGPEDGAPHFAMRRFTLAPGAEVPRHTNDVEHEQYVLAGEYVVGIGDEEYVVGPGDSLLVPGGTVHWYRNDGDEEGAFVCVVPDGDDSIELVE